MVRIPLLPCLADPPPGSPAHPDPFLPLHREVDWPFGGALDRPSADLGIGPSDIVLTPHVEVTETEAAVRIVAQLPGV